MLCIDTSTNVNHVKLIRNKTGVPIETLPISPSGSELPVIPVRIPVGNETSASKTVVFMLDNGTRSDKMCTYLEVDGLAIPTTL